MENTVYVIIPAYNAQEYLEKCIDSVFCANSSPVQIVCVNDGSTDSTSDILQSLSEKYSQLAVIQTTNKGPSQARNMGLDCALKRINPSDFLMFIDADDWLSPGYIDELVLESKKGNDIVCSSFTFANGKNSHPFHGMDSIFGRYDGFEATKLLLADRTIQSHPHCKLFKASLWNGIRFPLGIDYMEDQATLFKVFAKADKISLISNYGYMYRQHGNSLCAAPFTNKKTLDGMEGYKEACIYGFKNMDDRQSAELKDAALQAFASAFLTLYSHYSRVRSTNDDKKRYHAILSFVKTQRIIRKFIPANKKERIKKWMFSLARPLYRPLYRLLRRKERTQSIVSDITSSC